jgi:hypothetical protein
MRKLVWALIGVGLVIWSALAWLAYGIIHWGGNVASGNMDQISVDPESVELLSWLAVFGTDLAQWIIIGVWGLGVVVAVGLGFLGQKLMPRLQTLKNQIRPT